MSYRLHLIALRCVSAQENDGDEIYLKVDGDTIFTWQEVGYKFVSALKNDTHIIAYDFRQAKINTQSGWHVNSAYTPDQFVLTRDVPCILELWESDAGEFLRGGDDDLGKVLVDASQAGKGELVAVFNLNNAEYELRYRVDAS